MSIDDHREPASRRPHWLRWVYVLLAIGGLVIPNIYFVQAWQAGDLPRFWDLLWAGLFANAPAAMLATDFMIIATVGIVWSLTEAYRLHMRWWLLAILMLLIPFGCLFPAFLFLRERALDKAEHDGAATTDRQV